MSSTDVVGLSNRYSELLKKQRDAITPVERVAVQLEMLEIEVALSMSRLDFFT